MSEEQIVNIIYGYETPSVKCKVCGKENEVSNSGDPVPCPNCSVTFLDGKIISDSWAIQPSSVKKCYQASVIFHGVRKTVFVLAKDIKEANAKLERYYHLIEEVHLAFQSDFID